MRFGMRQQAFRLAGAMETHARAISAVVGDQAASEEQAAAGFHQLVTKKGSRTKSDSLFIADQAASAADLDPAAAQITSIGECGSVKSRAFSTV